MDTEDTQVTEAIEAKTLTNWQAVGIGATTGLVLMILFLAFVPTQDVRNPWDPYPWERSWHFFWKDFILPWLMNMYDLWPIMVFGIVGALVGKFLKETRRATWIGALLLGSLSVVAISIGLIFAMGSG